MSIEEVRELFAYDDWANARLLEALERLTAEQSGKTVASSFPSLRETLAHMVVAEWFWLHRWLGDNPKEAPAWASGGSLPELRQALTGIQSDRAALLDRLSHEALAEPAPYRDPGGAEHRQRLGDQMRHVVNHSTYHRGQAATQLRQLGEVPPGTDLILYLRETG
jgi:uncharacterized damage-inducible protein DinB